MFKFLAKNQFNVILKTNPRIIIQSSFFAMENKLARLKAADDLEMFTWYQLFLYPANKFFEPE